MPSTLHCALAVRGISALAWHLTYEFRPDRPSSEQKTIDRRDAIRERPLEFKSLDKNTDGEVDCNHVSGLT
jgi:hypothetical protein